MKIAHKGPVWLPICMLLTAGCGPAPDPPFRSGDGDMAPAMVEAIRNATGRIIPSARVAGMNSLWSSRVLTSQDHSMRDGLPNDWQAVQFCMDPTNLTAIRDWLTESLGAPMTFGTGTN